MILAPVIPEDLKKGMDSRTFQQCCGVAYPLTASGCLRSWGRYGHRVRGLEVSTVMLEFYCPAGKGLEVFYGHAGIGQ